MIPVACIHELRYRPGASSARFVSATVDHFADTGEWPSLSVLQKALVEQRDRSDARREARRLPHGYGRQEEDEVVLSVRGIYSAEPNHPLLDDFERVLRWAVWRYRRGPRRADATLSERELVDELGLSEDRARRAITLLVSESLIAPAPGGDAFVIRPRIRHFLRVRGVEQYVRKEARIDFCRRIKRAAAKPLGLPRWFVREDTKVWEKIVVGALAAFLAAVLATAVLSGPGPSGSEDRPNRPHAIKPQPARDGR